MKVAGIVTDNWKATLFKKRLKQAGYQFDEEPFTGGNTLLRVKYDDIKHLNTVVRAANQECEECR